MTDLHFPAGTYRIASATRMKAGDQALGVVCHGCGIDKPLFAVPGIPPTCFGKGKLSIPCDACLTDDLYGVDELRIFIVRQDVGPKRVDPSGQYRRALNESYPGAKHTFGANFVENRPIAAVIIARCISLWSEVEKSTAGLISNFLGSDAQTGIAMFLAIRNSRTQSEVIGEAAKIHLADRDLRLFNAIMHLKWRIETERNRLAHGHFGYAPAIKTGLLWVSMEDNARYSLQHSLPTEDKTKWLSERVWVYEPEDLETIAQEIEDLIQTLGQFSAYLAWNPGQRRDERFQQLCGFPHVAEALAHLDGQKKNRPKQQERKKKGRR